MRLSSNSMYVLSEVSNNNFELRKLSKYAVGKHAQQMKTDSTGK
jgi:hypothetical protein